MFRSSKLSPTETDSGGPTFAEKLHNCFGSISADFGVGVGEGEAVEQQLAQGAHLADLKQRQKQRERPSITRSSVRARFFLGQDEEPYMYDVCRVNFWDL